MKISNKVINLIDSKHIINPTITFLCVGTDKVVGDAIGPLVGSNIKNYVKNNNIKNIKVIGSLENPLNNTNLKNIKISKGTNILIDSAISNTYEIGKVIVEEKAIEVRNALNDNKEVNSEISIKAVVCKNTGNETLNFIRLQNVSIKTIIEMSEEISNEMFKVIEKYF